jgi:hypothetical protein
MDASLRNAARQRAANRCEYCRIAQEHDPYFRFHIEHVIPRQHGGGDNADNLALACMHCNLHKGPNLAGIDPDTGQLASLFNPRLQGWDEHFRMDGEWVVGLTASGRVTVYVLAMNAEDQRRIRSLG